MKIVVLCENSAQSPYQSEHGLSLYIETRSHRVLFDCGQSDLFIKNANTAGIDLTKVDIVILSHGHYDHCGGVLAFHQINPQATIYIHKNAGEEYYHIEANVHKYIGIDPAIMALPNIKLCDGNMIIDEELEIVSQIAHRHALFGNYQVLKRKMENEYEVDDFTHEMVLLIHDDIHLLCGGCAHNGILNIMESVEQQVDVVISGFHLKKKDYCEDDDQYIKELGYKLKKYPTVFYSGHCTGNYAYRILKEILQDQLEAIHSGKVIKTDKIYDE